MWRSPRGQPVWARPALLAVALVAGVGYAWQLDSADLEPFYGAAARSMSTSWHDFFFGAFDPAGTVTVDKLPGALWVQALSLRLLGFHVWAVVLPQVLEGVLAILVLYRAVRRLAGATAAITAAVLLALSPVTVALNRGNVSDSLLVLLTILAADATSKAILNGRLRTLLLAGVWVGLAFQAKMMQAWLVLPGLACAYLLAAPGRLRHRTLQAGCAGLLTLVVSFAWMTVVSLVPTHERPYVDGTRNDSLFSQVFDYNGIARLTGRHDLAALIQPAGFLVKLQHASLALNAASAGIPAGWDRLLGGLFARDAGWLYPATLIGTIAVLIARRGAGRRDPLRACVVLWGLWLIVLFLFFSEGAYLNSYYLAAIAPATAALCGTGVALATEHWEQPRARVLLALAVLTSVAYGMHLLAGASQVPVWLAPVAGALGVLAVLLAARARLPWRGVSSLPLVLACGLLLPATASLQIITRDQGPFNAPYEPAHPTVSAQLAYRRGRLLLGSLAFRYPAPVVLGAYSSTLAAPYILASGREVLPVGGYLGGIPSPTLPELEHDIATGRVQTFLLPLSPPNSDPRILWLLAHCQRFTHPRRGDPIQLALYHCPYQTQTAAPSAYPPRARRPRK